jgi:hypothetical protein
LLRPLSGSAQPVDVVLTEVALHLQRLGMYPGDTVFDATVIVLGFLRAISIPLKARSGLGEAPADIGPVIEIVGSQWAITEIGIESLEHQYVIGKEQVHEDDWQRHMSEKVWVDQDQFRDALHLAKSLWPRG